MSESEAIKPGARSLGAYEKHAVPFSREFAGKKVQAFFQPYFDTREGQPKRGELLTHPLQPIQSGDFFSELEISTQVELLAWLISAANELATKYQVHSSINIHNSFIEPITGRETFLKLVEKASSAITIEFTETFRMPPVETSNAMLRKVRELGHTTALDDFGTGLNGMSLLVDYDFDEIKIDRILTVGVDTSPKKTKVLSLIKEMLDVLEKTHVVEGVETKEVYETLCELGFTTFQGFYFHKPIPVDDYLHELEAESKK